MYWIALGARTPPWITGAEGSLSYPWTIGLLEQLRAGVCGAAQPERAGQWGLNSLTPSTRAHSEHIFRRTLRAYVAQVRKHEK